MSAPTRAPASSTLTGSVNPPDGNLPMPTAPGQPEFTPPPPSRTPQLLRRLQVATALVLLVLGGVGTLLITQLRSDLDSAPEVAAQSARLGEVQTRLLGAATLAAEGVLKGNGATTAQATDAGTRVGEAVGLLVEAATARPQDTAALSKLSREVTAFGVALRAADGRDTATARSLLEAADKQLDGQVLPDLAILQEALATEASAQALGWAFVMPALGLAAAGFLIWVSWVVAQRSRRALNLGLVGALVAVLVIGWVTLAAQQATGVAAGQSRGAQFARVTSLNEGSTQIDRARRVQAEALLARSWSDAQAKAVDAAIDAAAIAADTTSARSQLATYRTAARALAGQLAKADWAAAGKLALSTDKSGVAATSAAFQKTVAAGRTQAANAAAEAAAEVSGGLPWQLAAVILAALVGAGLAVAGLAQRLVEYR